MQIIKTVRPSHQPCGLYSNRKSRTFSWQHVDTTHLCLLIQIHLLMWLKQFSLKLVCIWGKMRDIMLTVMFTTLFLTLCSSAEKQVCESFHQPLIKQSHWRWKNWLGIRLWYAVGEGVGLEQVIWTKWTSNWLLTDNVVGGSVIFGTGLVETCIDLNLCCFTTSAHEKSNFAWTKMMCSGDKNPSSI